MSIKRPKDYITECKKVISLANRGSKQARCCFCQRAIFKTDDPLEIGFAIKEKPKSYVLWHIDCYCKNNEITRADYMRLEGLEF